MLIVEQPRAGSTYRVRDTVSDVRYYPPKGQTWTLRDAKREAERLAGDASAKPLTCPRCHRRIGGTLLPCRCVPEGPEAPHGSGNRT
jgi:hypothetical protein